MIFVMEFNNNSQSDEILFLKSKSLFNPSIHILQREIKENFKSSTPKKFPAFPNYNATLQWPNSKIIDIVLFGDALHRLSSLRLWPENHNYRIHTLCTSMRDLIIDTYELKPDQVRSINRYDLYPKNNSPSKFPDLFKDKLTLVMSGRSSNYKNTKQTIHVASLLQRGNPNIKLVICGPSFDEQYLKDAISLCTWKNPPILLGDLGHEWINQIPKDYVFINLSTSPAEDFNVSSAQAQNKGMPMIITHWGGLKDIDADNILKIPAAIAKDGFKVMDYIKNPTSTFEKTNVSHSCEHEFISFQDLNIKANEFKEKYKNGLINYTSSSGRLYKDDPILTKINYFFS